MIVNLKICRLFDSRNNNNIKILLKSCVVVMLLLSLFINSFLGFVNFNESNYNSFTKFKSFNSSIQNSNSSSRISYFNYNFFKLVNIEKSIFTNTFSLYLYLGEINELFELELDDFINCYSKDYKFYQNFIDNSYSIDKLLNNHSKIIPLYILFHCLKIHLSL